MGALMKALVFLAQFCAPLLAFSGQHSHDRFHARSSQDQPCAQVSKAYSAQFASNPETTQFEVSAQLAYDCLESVPINPVDALRVVDGLVPFLDWQSTLQYLRDPPDGYLLPAIDIRKGIQEIRNKVIAEKFKGEYEFQDSLLRLVGSAHDSHFRLALDASSVFIFRRPAESKLVSVSLDGKELPKVYCHEDVNITSPKGWTPSAVKAINGKAVSQWLEEYSQTSSVNQDPDAMYNALFYSIPIATLGSGGAFLASEFFPGPTTAFEFENGTKREFENRASFAADFSNIKDGENFYENFCNGDKLEARSIQQRDRMVAPQAIETRQETLDLRPLYPTSVDGMSSLAAAGYFLSGKHSDTAVLSVSVFAGLRGAGFSETISKFLQACKEHGKKKLVIDVSGNGGGLVFPGYDLFKQLFPDIEPKDAYNVPAMESIKIVGSKINEVISDQNSDGSGVDSIFDIRSMMDANGKKFNNWDDFFGLAQNTANRHEFTNIARWDFSSETTSGLSGGGRMIVSGYRNNSDLPPQVFKPEDMVLLTDGTCASDCSLFANLLKVNGVKSIATGGRPREGKMQAVGGVKGAQLLTFNTIYTAATQVYNDYGTPEERRKWDSTALGELVHKGAYFMARGGSGSRVNYRNMIEPGDERRTPRQFVYEPADCRIWFTKEMLFDMNALWMAAANAAWHDGGCVPGSNP